MKWLDVIDKGLIIPVYKQIIDSVLNAIEDGELEINSRIPSINKICVEFGLAPGTVIRAYDELKDMGIVSSQQGKGFFISNTSIQQKHKIFLLFDRINPFKEIIYESFVDHLGKDSEINVFFHHYDRKRFEKFIRDNIGRYSHYVVMSHLQEDVSRILHKISERKLILIDANVPKYTGSCNAVYQHFEKDIFTGLESGLDMLVKYKKLVLSLSKSRFQFVPEGCKKGFEKFCNKYQLEHEIVPNLFDTGINIKNLYIVYNDAELFYLIKKNRELKWEIGKDIGIISYDDTPMKSILAGGISVLTTDFHQMGKTAAQMVKGEIMGKIHNPFRLIYRNSF